MNDQIQIIIILGEFNYLNFIINLTCDLRVSELGEEFFLIHD